MPFKPRYHVPEIRRSYTMRAGKTGVLMLHGFMGSGVSSRPMAEFLSSRGITMHCPLLPGHGNLPDKLKGVTREDWLAEVEEGLRFLRTIADEVFLIGHSMGAAVGAELCDRHEGISGLVLIGPVYRPPDNRIRLLAAISPLMPWFYPMKIKSLVPLTQRRMLDFDPTLDLNDPEVQAWLPKGSRLPTSALRQLCRVLDMARDKWSSIYCPTAIFQGGDDEATETEDSVLILERIVSSDKQMITIEEAGHELMRPADPCHQEVWDGILDFILTRSTL